MSDTVFLTGATGYIGSSLLQTWLEKTDAKIVVLARGKRDKKPGARVENALAGLSPAGVNGELPCSKQTALSYWHFGSVRQ